MIPKLLKDLELYRRQWADVSADPVVYQRHAVTLRRGLSAYRDRLVARDQPGAGPATEKGTATDATTTFKPKSAGPPHDRPRDPEPARTRRDQATTSGTYLRPDPGMMKARIEAKRRGDEAKIVEKATGLLREIDRRIAAHEPDRRHVNELFDQVKEQLNLLRRPDSPAPAPGGQKPPHDP